MQKLTVAQLVTALPIFYETRSSSNALGVREQHMFRAGWIQSLIHLTTHFHSSNGMMSPNDELEKMWKETVVINFKTFPQYL
jgi:urocanate hydratase